MNPRDCPLRILYHHRVAASDGMRVHINEVVQALRAEGHEVWVVGPDGDGAARKAGQGSRFERLAEFARAALPGALYEFVELAYNLPAYLRVRRAVREFEPDVIYERYNLFLLAGLLAARRARLPMLLEINAPLVKERCATGRLNLKALGRLCEAALWRGADVALPVTRALAEEVRRTRGDKPTEIAPNGADPARRPTPAAALQARMRLGLDSGELVLGFVGFVRPWHDVAMAVEALPELPRTAHLVVVGDGPGCKTLARRAEAAGVAGRLHLVGRVPHEDVSAYMSAFDVALQTAATPYASPLKLFEYMAFSLPIVAPDQPNIREVLADGAEALLFPPGDATRLAEALNRLAADPGLRRRLGAAARKRLEETPFTWTGAARRIAAVARQAKAARRCAATSAMWTTESPEPS
ncbi:MAG TPA: glycosyltransferase family 4 protein [Caulobacteraceae bacterium]|jgi:glycosyltransferase involved in cell wall biosynthesis|nr:glycosyltransferase family 4 protein [Caulobacteraceae bacterium]